MNEIYELTPVLKNYIWGGEKLKNYKETDLEKVAESWELSFLKDNESIATSAQEKLNLVELFKKEEVKNKKLQNVLIKLINSEKNLSIQVHPSDKYALKYENSLGKTEMRIILEAEEGAFLYIGLKENVSKDKFKELIKDDSILDHLNKVYVKPGDIYLIKSGTIHAIGAGITLAEIQENSNLTYRIYDYNRTDDKGNKRELHVEKALDVINFKPGKPKNLSRKNKIRTKYFETKIKENNSEKIITIKKPTFILVTNGSGKINDIEISKYKSYLLLSGKFEFKGTFSYILTD